MINWLKRLFRRKITKEVHSKITDIIGQIEWLETTKCNTVRPIGSTAYMSPKDLIEFQWKRIHTLEKALKQSKIEMKDEITIYYKNLCSDCQELYNHNVNLNVPCEKDYYDFSQVILIRDVLNDGTR